MNKVIAGAAAGSQGAVTIHAVCNGTALTPDFTVAAGRPAANYSYTWTGIAANSSCVVTETVNGSTTTVAVATVGSGQTVTVGAGQDAQATITNTYTFLTGSLTVTKTINGPAAGHQGPVTIKVSCDGDGTVARANRRCRVAGGRLHPHLHGHRRPARRAAAEETADGSTSTIDVAVSGERHISCGPGGRLGQPSHHRHLQLTPPVPW